MKNQKGFIKILLLIEIIVGILVLGGIGYIGVKQYQDYQKQKIQTQQQTDVQQKALEQAQAEIEKLKQDSETAKTKQQQLEQTIKATQNPATPASQDITSADIKPYLNTIGVIDCFDPNNNEQWGTGVLLTNGKLMTNYHVIDGMKSCGFVNDKFLNPKYTITAHNYRSFAYVLDLSNIQRPDNNIDFAIVPFNRNPSTIAQEYYGAPTDEYLEVNQLNYRVGSMLKCSDKVSIGTSVAILGYPASSFSLSTAPPESVTTGIISGYDSSYKSNTYVVSAKVDHGNSGGLALGKENGKVCLLGIPTWVVTGIVESAGVVQNINNLLK